MNRELGQAILSRMPKSLLANAYRVGNEAAWDRATALRTFDWLLDQRYAVVGIEIWLPGPRGPVIPTPFFYSWDAGLRQGEGWDTFLQRTHEEGTSYIAEFAWDARDSRHRDHEPYFNLEPLDRQGFDDLDPGHLANEIGEVDVP